MDQDTVYRLLASPQWTTQSSLLPTDPQFIAATHQTLADSLFCPCPEPPPTWLTRLKMKTMTTDWDEDADEDEIGPGIPAPDSDRDSSRILKP